MHFKDPTIQGILRSLAADEFLAWTSYYFYEIISQGKALNFTNKIFNKNGKDELEDHYHKLINWMQSNDIPVPTGLVEMQEICNTKYTPYTDPSNSGDLVEQMIKAEQEAIDTYVQAMKEPAVVAYPDLVVMLGEICTDEREHLKELTDVLSNITTQVPANFTERIRKSFALFGRDDKNEKYGVFELIGEKGKLVTSGTKESCEDQARRLSQKTPRYVVRKLTNLWSFSEDQDLSDVETKWTPPENLFAEGSADEIAKEVHKSHDSLKSAISCLNFYLNRGGDNIPDDRKKVVEEAKDKVREMYK